MTDPLGLAGARALVTGGSGELGEAIAARLLALGARVALVARTEGNLRDAARRLDAGGGEPVWTLTCDVTDAAAVEAMVADAESRFGPLDVVVNNAGGALFLAELADVRPDGLAKALALNLQGAFAVAQVAGARMRERGAGAIVNIASISGVRPVPGMDHYGAAKAGLLMLTRSLAVEWAASGVRVNAVVPGFVTTGGWERMRAHPGYEAATTSVPMPGGWVSPEQVAWAVAFLGSPRAAGITGAALPVDGGMAAA